MTKEMQEEMLAEKETLDWVKSHEELRGRNIDDIKSKEGVSSFTFGESLRLTWFSQQRADKELARIIDDKSIPDGYRIGQDGVLEREIK